jgi:hypothetical protein
MEIIKFNDVVWQLVDYTGRILKIGTYDECLDKLCELESHSEYLDFLRMSGI